MDGGLFIANLRMNEYLEEDLINLKSFVSGFVLADLQFPIDLSNVAKDHPFLENDPLQSLYRRLVALNRCATMRLDNAHHNKHQAQVNIHLLLWVMENGEREDIYINQMGNEAK